MYITEQILNNGLWLLRNNTCTEKRLPLNRPLNKSDLHHLSYSFLLKNDNLSIHCQIFLSQCSTCFLHPPRQLFCICL